MYYPVLRIFFHPGSGSASKNLSILTPKVVSKLSEIWSGLFNPDPYPRSVSWFFTHPGSRSQGSKGTWSRIRIRNTGFIWPLWREVVTWWSAWSRMTWTARRSCSTSPGRAPSPDPASSSRATSSPPLLLGQLLIANVPILFPILESLVFVIYSVP